MRVHFLRALSKESSSPAQIPLSKYQKLTVRLSTSELSVSTRMYKNCEKEMT